MMKKRIAVFMFVLLLCCVGVSAAADDSDFTIEDGVLSKYTGSGGDVVIPNGVTTIAEYAFYQCTGVTSVTIPNGVTTIENYAFQDCTGLTRVSIPDSVSSIGWGAFDRCEKLKSVAIPYGVNNIGYSTFGNCTSLTSVSIPNSVINIVDYAFGNCDSLLSITIPNSVQSIDYGAFYDCDNLTIVTIGSGVTAIEDHAFGICPGLTDVYYPGDESQWNRIAIELSNYALLSANIHYNSAGPDASHFTPGETLIAAAGSPCALTLDFSGVEGLTAGAAVRIIYAAYDSAGQMITPVAWEETIPDDLHVALTLPAQEAGTKCKIFLVNGNDDASPLARAMQILFAA